MLKQKLIRAHTHRRKRRREQKQLKSQTVRVAVSFSSHAYTQPHNNLSPKGSFDRLNFIKEQEDAIVKSL
jgi:hypothetical protein